VQTGVENSFVAYFFMEIFVHEHRNPLQKSTEPCTFKSMQQQQQQQHCVDTLDSAARTLISTWSV